MLSSILVCLPLSFKYTQTHSAQTIRKTVCTGNIHWLVISMTTPPLSPYIYIGLP